MTSRVADPFRRTRRDSSCVLNDQAPFTATPSDNIGQPVKIQSPVGDYAESHSGLPPQTVFGAFAKSIPKSPNYYALMRSNGPLANKKVATHPRHSCAGEGAVHSINSGHGVLSLYCGDVLPASYAADSTGNAPFRKDSSARIMYLSGSTGQPRHALEDRWLEPRVLCVMIPEFAFWTGRGPVV
jgi:hypothetical protein